MVGLVCNHLAADFFICKCLSEISRNPCGIIIPVLADNSRSPVSLLCCIGCDYSALKGVHECCAQIIFIACGYLRIRAGCADGRHVCVRKGLSCGIGNTRAVGADYPCNAFRNQALRRSNSRYLVGLIVCLHQLNVVYRTVQLHGWHDCIGIADAQNLLLAAVAVFARGWLKYADFDGVRGFGFIRLCRRNLRAGAGRSRIVIVIAAACRQRNCHHRGKQKRSHFFHFYNLP